MARFYALAADLVLVLHAAFVLFVVGGQVLTLVGWARNWRWTRAPVFRLAQLAAVGLVVLEAWWAVACPLTVLEDRLRTQAGETPYATSFIGHWLQRILFYSAPEWVFVLIYSAFGLAVLLTFVFYPPRRPLFYMRRRRD